MFSLRQNLKVYIAIRPVDFRKGHDGLAAYVQEVLQEKPYEGSAFVFRSKRGDRIKVLLWDGNGLVLCYKRLEEGRFVWPRVSGGIMQVNGIQFEALFAGLDWQRVREVKAHRPLLAT